MINILFWCITVPGIYLAGMCLTYWILCKTPLVETKEDKADARTSAMLWVITVPILLVFCFVHLLEMMLDTLNGGDK